MACHQFICWAPLDPNGPKIFGFAEYLAALALIVIAWTISDWRYRFHLQTARLHVRRIAFFTVAAVGALTLATDIWRASGYPVPVGNVVSPVLWQGFLGGIFLAAFIMWATTAFLSPPRFNHKNAHRFISTTYRYSLAGNPSDLDQLADALEPSAARIISMAGDNKNREATLKARLAAEMLHAMADPKFCAAAVRSAPLTLQAIFETLRKTPSASPHVTQFARNVLIAAIAESTSFLHRENADWQSGLAAQGQWVTKCLYGDIDVLDRLRFVFAARGAHDWSADGWEAYLRAAGHAFQNYVKQARTYHSQTISNIFHTIDDGTRNLHRLNGISDWTLESDAYRRAEAILSFIDEAAAALETSDVQIAEWNAMDEYHNPVQQLARISAKMLLDAANVRSPSPTNWWVQHNLVWSRIFDRNIDGAELVKGEIRERVVRMVWGEVAKLDYTPNYVGARLLGLCLNIAWVRGTQIRSVHRGVAEAALLRLGRTWATRRFAWLYKYNPSVATSGFSDLMTYNPKKRVLRRMWEPSAYRPVATFTTLPVVAPLPGPAEGGLLPFDQMPDKMVSRRRSVPLHLI